MEAYLSAAGNISRLAIGTETAPTLAVFDAPHDTSQNEYVEGLPFGTRGGMLIEHEFPADAYYVFQVFPVNQGTMGGSTAFGQMTRANSWRCHCRRRAGAPVRLGRGTEKRAKQSTPVRTGMGPDSKAGAHRGREVPRHDYAPGNDLNAKFPRTTIQTGAIPRAGHALSPPLGRARRIEGPCKAKGAKDTPSRHKIFSCASRRARRSEEACAREIVTSLARRAYRRPPTPQDVGTLMEFYLAGRNDGKLIRDRAPCGGCWRTRNSCTAAKPSPSTSQWAKRIA